MLRNVVLGLGLACLASPVFASCTGDAFLDRLTPADFTALDAVVAATPYPRGLIWEATKDDRSLSVIGTMHIHDPRLDDLFAQIAPRLQSATLLLVEATPAEESQMQAAIANTPDMVFITDGPTLPEQLDAELWSALAAAAAERQIPPFLAAKMQPWYLSLSLSIPPCAMPDLLSGRRGLDHMLMAEADALGIPVQAVEPWTTLLDVMQHGSQQDQIEMLELAMLAPGLQGELYVSMLDAYFAQDVAMIWEASRLATRFVPGLDPARADELFAQTETLLLDDRNRNWMPVVTAATKAHANVMLAVGAAHLPGENGVLNLLAKDGWAITGP